MKCHGSDGAGGTAKETESARRSLVLVSPDGDSLALAVAASFVAAARRSVKARGLFTVALAGGSTPRRAYELLAQSPFADLVAWERVHVFWGDERCVDPGDARSNERMAREALLDRVPIPGEQVHPMRCGGGQNGVESGDDGALERLARSTAEDYERLLRGFPPVVPEKQRGGLPAGENRRQTALDLVLLGLGADGHTASLFPGSEAAQAEERWCAVSLAGAGATTGTTISGAAGSSAAEAGGPLWRVTLTAPLINRSGSVIFVVGGPAKAAIVKEVLEGPVDPLRLPAQLIKPVNGDLRWYLDDDSASLLAETAMDGALYPPRPF